MLHYCVLIGSAASFANYISRVVCRDSVVGGNLICFSNHWPLKCFDSHISLCFFRFIHMFIWSISAERSKSISYCDHFCCFGVICFGAVYWGIRWFVMIYRWLNGSESQNTHVLSWHMADDVRTTVPDHSRWTLWTESIFFAILLAFIYIYICIYILDFFVTLF